MWCGNSRSSMLLASCFIILILSTQAKPTPRTSISGANRYADEQPQPLALAFTSIAPPMSGSSHPFVSHPAKRDSRMRTQHLAGGLLVQYVRFNSFARVPDSFIKLSYFWQYLAYGAMFTPSERFDKSIFTFRFAGLRIQMFNMGGVVPRELVLAVANVMSKYTARGFWGLLNARITGHGHVMGVSIMVDDR